MPSAGDTIAYRFRLIRELGHGSMGTVWLAWHLTLEVPCALKFIVSEGANDAAYRTRFDTEARTTAQLRSPNVVRVLDHSLSEDVAPYIAMEFLDGEDLRARLSRVGRLDARATCDLVSQIARGLAEAHAAGIVHRDLKPENIFFAREGEQEVVKILDFGVARWNARSPVDEGDGLIGTLEYMSPEVACGASVDYRYDLWALSVIAYECLTGCLPFRGDSIPQVLASIRGGVAPLPSEVVPELGPDFDRWWTRATSRTIEDRLDGAPELARSLRRTLGLAEAEGNDGESLRADGAHVSSLASIEGYASPMDRPRARPRARAMLGLVAASLLAVAVAVLLSARVTGERFDASFVRSTLGLATPSSVENLLLRARAALPRVTLEPAATLGDSTVAATLAAPPSEPRPPEPAPSAAPPPAVASAFRVATPPLPPARPAKTVRPKPAAPMSMTRDAGPDDDTLPAKVKAVVDFGI
jgi:serine/threonine protein kinase